MSIRFLQAAALGGALLAPLMFALALLAGAGSFPGYASARHAVGLLGSALAPHAAAFNVFGFVLPGLCVAGFAFALEHPLRATGIGRMGRLATSLLLISGLAFAAQGVLPFDPADLDGTASRRHVFAFTIALLAWLPSTLLLALAVRGRPAWRPLPLLGVAFATAMIVCLLWPADQWLPGWSGHPGHAQRLIFLLYFAWLALVAILALRRAPGAGG